MLHLYNNRTRTKELFQPLEEKQVKLYVCGMTVYDYCHIGHARTCLFFDTMVRYFRHVQYQVTYIRNITDIDDKIIRRAHELNEDPAVLAERFTQIMHDDFQQLGLIAPDQEPRATLYIPQIVRLIQMLLDRGFAYVGSDRDVYFDVSKFSAYGALSNRRLEELKVGIRVEPSEAKQDPLDFVLWKAIKPGEPSWEAPWGRGRPGWHIECSAMALDCLGNSIDIHGGGLDLLFPHHENEVAQSEAATGQRYVNYWIHVGHLEVDNLKMSKSLGNYFTIRDILKQVHPEVLRYFMLMTHYRKPLNYSQEALEQAREGLTKLYLTLRDIPPIEEAPQSTTIYEQQFFEAMEDDFNTPKVLSILFELSHEIHRQSSGTLSGLLKRLGQILGLFQISADHFLQNLSLSEVSEIQNLIQQRNQARAQKDWKTADHIRLELEKRGIELEDKKDQATTWRKT